MQFNEYNSSKGSKTSRLEFPVAMSKVLQILLILLVAVAPSARAVDPRPDENIRPNQYGLVVLEKLADYDASVAADSAMALVDLERSEEHTS